MKRCAFTPDQIEQAREFFEQGLSALRAGKLMGRSRGSMIGLWWRMGWSKSAPAESEQLAEARRVRKNATRPYKDRPRRRVPRPKRPPVPPPLHVLFVNPQDRRAGR